VAMSQRHLRRLFTEHLGVTPDQLAQSRRAHFARRLLDDTDLTVADIAFASGFGSLRQFNRTMRVVFRASPIELRDRRRRSDRLVADGGLMMRLPFLPPYAWNHMLGFLAQRAVPGVESVSDGVYRRTISLDGAPGVLEVHPGGHDHLLLRAHLPYWEGLIHVVERVSRMVGTDVDTSPAVQHLTHDPVIGPLLGTYPGLRVPGAWGPLEIAVHAIIAQHNNLDDTQRHLGALVRHCGQPVPGLEHQLAHLFPSAQVLSATDLDPTGIPPSAAQSTQDLATKLCAGAITLDGSPALADLVADLTAIDGIETTAAHQIALRLGHRDAYPESDKALDTALALHHATPPSARTAEQWRPWRSLAATLLMTHATTNTSTKATPA
jgi:AraC family transcriptional regulator, regulatory protein of adaptative response / DNA-3-methyladenine glycosylase II